MERKNSKWLKISLSSLYISNFKLWLKLYRLKLNERSENNGNISLYNSANKQEV